jgi:hypothetical protein
MTNVVSYITTGACAAYFIAEGVHISARLYYIVRAWLSLEPRERPRFVRAIWH